MFFFKKKSANHITVLPHPGVCPAGEVLSAVVGKSIAQTLIDNELEISHSCQLQCACTTCHIHLMEGEACVSPMHADEAKMLDTTGKRQRWSRLACQTIFQGGGDLVVELCD